MGKVHATKILQKTYMGMMGLCITQVRLAISDREGNYLNRRVGVGGGGGGAAVGDHPNPLDTSKNGTDGYLSGMTPYGGAGGRGGHADAGADATTYGGAGNGGHGGGGGGGGGSTATRSRKPRLSIPRPWWPRWLRR
jgi:hypothetical protein